MSHVDVLNATYTPLGKTRLPRAIALVQDGAAVVEKADPFAPIRSAELTFATPLVIRMLRFIDVPMVWSVAYWTREGVLERDNYTCAYCGENFEHDRTKVNVDHIKPRSRGGDNSWTNTICACIPCNTKKDSFLLEEIGMELLFEPKKVYRQYYQGKKARKHAKK